MILQGAATRLVPDPVEGGNPLFPLSQKARIPGLIAGARRACAPKIGIAEAAKALKLPLIEPDIEASPRRLDQPVRATPFWGLLAFR